MAGSRVGVGFWPARRYRNRSASAGHRENDSNGTDTGTQGVRNLNSSITNTRLAGASLCATKIPPDRSDHADSGQE